MKKIWRSSDLKHAVNLWITILQILPYLFNSWVYSFCLYTPIILNTLIIQTPAVINSILCPFKGNWAVSMEAKPLCTRQTVSLSQFLRFCLFCIFPAPSICYWVLQLLLLTAWPMLHVSHTSNLLLSPSPLPYCPLLLPDRPCPFLSVAQSVDSVVEDWDTYNGKLSLRPAMLTLHSLLLGIHVSTIWPLTPSFLSGSYFCSLLSFVPLSWIFSNTMAGMRARWIIDCYVPSSICALLNNRGAG